MLLIKVHKNPPKNILRTFVISPEEFHPSCYLYVMRKWRSFWLIPCEWCEDMLIKVPPQISHKL